MSDSVLPIKFIEKKLLKNLHGIEKVHNFALVKRK